MTDRELMQQALEALDWAADCIEPRKPNNCDCPVCVASDALRARLAQPEQEPDGIGWLRKDGGYFAAPHRTHWEGCEEVHPECRKPEQEPVAWAFWHSDRSWHDISDTEHSAGMKPLYTTPPRREWVGLTEEEVDECYYWKGRQWTTDELVRHVEAKLKEKNA